MVTLRPARDSALLWIGPHPYFTATDGTQWRLQDLLLAGRWVKRVTPGHRRAQQRVFIGPTARRVYTFRELDDHDVTFESLERQFRESVPE
jgi:hypothetical protein